MSEGVTRAMLWITRPKLLLERAGGLACLERQLITLERAGIRAVWIGAKSPGEAELSRLRLPKTLELHWSARAAEASAPTPKECAAPYLGVSGDHFIAVETLAHIARAAYPGSASFTDPAGLSVVQHIAANTADEVAYHKQPLPEGSSVYLDSPLADGPALDWLLSLGPKAHDGFMARHFDRHISLAVSRALLDAPVHPNAMTLFSCLVGLAGAAMFAGAAHRLDAAGAFLVWLHSVLDGCDGELARIRFQESAWGGALDFWGDNLVHLALFSAIGVGFYRSLASPLPLILGACAGVGILGSAAAAFLRRKRPRPAPSLLTRLEDILAQRDFIYVLLAMTFLGLTYQFLWAGAVGAPLFLVLTFSGVERTNEKTARAAA